MGRSNEQPTGLLAGMRILVVEDEYFIADDLRRCLTEAGATIIGPVSTLAKAHDALEQRGFDCAILDLNLHDESAIPIAERLAKIGIPFVIATGYGSPAVPDHLRSRPRCEKPFDPAELVSAVAQFARTGA